MAKYRITQEYINREIYEVDADTEEDAFAKFNSGEIPCKDLDTIHNLSAEKMGQLDWSTGIAYTDEGWLYIVGTREPGSLHWMWGFAPDKEADPWDVTWDDENYETPDDAADAAQADYDRRKQDA